MRILNIVIILVLAFLSSMSYGDDGVISLETAVASLDRVIEQHARTEDPERVLQAAAALEFVMSEQGIETSAGHLTLGNAYFIGNDFGRAVIHYRRGLEIDPGDKILARNLTHVRSFIEPTIPSDEFGWDLNAVLLSWQGLVSRWALWIVSVGLMGIGCIVWSLKILRGGRVAFSRTPIALIAFGVCGIGLLGYEHFSNQESPGVVIVLAGTGLYSGPGSAVYQELYDGALGVGTEARVLEERGEWSRIELMNGDDGWVSTQSFELISRPDEIRVF